MRLINSQDLLQRSPVFCVKYFSGSFNKHFGGYHLRAYHCTCLRTHISKCCQLCLIHLSLTFPTLYTPPITLIQTSLSPQLHSCISLPIPSSVVLTICKSRNLFPILEPEWFSKTWIWSRLSLAEHFSVVSQGLKDKVQMAHQDPGLLTPTHSPHQHFPSIHLSSHARL